MENKKIVKIWICVQFFYSGALQLLSWAERRGWENTTVIRGRCSAMNISVVIVHFQTLDNKYWCFNVTDLRGIHTQIKIFFFKCPTSAQISIMCTFYFILLLCKCWVVASRELNFTSWPPSSFPPSLPPSSFPPSLPPSSFPSIFLVQFADLPL